MESLVTADTNFLRSNLIYIIVIILAILLGAGTGYTLANHKSTIGASSNNSTSSGVAIPTSDQQQTFRDFAEGTIQPKPTGSQDDYSEGQYILQRDGAQPVALTSSVLDLSQYIGKKVKVYGETQKALKAGWLMDVGKVDVIQ